MNDWLHDVTRGGQIRLGKEVGGISIFRGTGQQSIACNRLPPDTWTALVMSIVNLMAQPQDKGLKHSTLILELKPEVTR